MRKAASALLVAILCWASASALAEADRLHLRDGRELEGRVVREVNAVYTVAVTEPSRMLSIPKQAVAYVLYGDRARAERYLDLERATRLGKDASRAAVTFLPAEAFGEAIIEAVSKARHSIWITVYIISGSVSGRIAEFYELLREKARSGVDVVMICEFSSGTRPSLRHATLNFVEGLARDNVEVVFIQEYKSMHKKMIIVDKKCVLLGSSNLTLTGTRFSNEMNVWIRSKPFAHQVVEDFKRLRARAKPATELD